MFKKKDNIFLKLAFKTIKIYMKKKNTFKSNKEYFN